MAGEAEGENGWGRRSNWVLLSEPERQSGQPVPYDVSQQVGSRSLHTLIPVHAVPLSPGTWCVPGWCIKTQKSPGSDSGSQQASGGGLPGWGTSVATGDLPTHFQHGPRVASSTSPRLSTILHSVVISWALRMGWTRKELERDTRLWAILEGWVTVIPGSAGSTPGSRYLKHRTRKLERLRRLPR